MNATPCRRPPAGTSKEALIAAHKSKMMGKHFRDQERGRTVTEQALGMRRRLRPNVSQRVLDEREKRELKALITSPLVTVTKKVRKSRATKKEA